MPMKKTRESSDPEMLPEYDFTGGERGKYAKRYAEGSNVAEALPDAEPEDREPGA